MDTSFDAQHGVLYLLLIRQASKCGQGRHPGTIAGATSFVTLWGAITLNFSTTALALWQMAGGLNGTEMSKVFPKRLPHRCLQKVYLAYDWEPWVPHSNLELQIKANKWSESYRYVWFAMDQTNRTWPGFASFIATAQLWPFIAGGCCLCQ